MSTTTIFPAIAIPRIPTVTWLWLRSLFRAQKRPAARPLSPMEEAEQLRALADEWLQTDPALAQDLYMAADRHELFA